MNQNDAKSLVFPDSHAKVLSWMPFIHGDSKRYSMVQFAGKIKPFGRPNGAGWYSSEKRILRRKFRYTVYFGKL